MEDFNRSVPLNPAREIVCLAERAPAHRRVKLVTEPQTWNMMQKKIA